MMQDKISDISFDRMKINKIVSYPEITMTYDKTKQIGYRSTIRILFITIEYTFLNGYKYNFNKFVEIIIIRFIITNVINYYQKSKNAILIIVCET